MGFSRTARIKTLLVIDTAFFLVELIVGEYYMLLSTLLTYSRICRRVAGPRRRQLPHAQVRPFPCVIPILICPSDVLSLIVALYAIKVCFNTPSLHC